MTKLKFLGVLTFISVTAVSALAADFGRGESTTFPSFRSANEGERMPHIGLMLGTARPEGSFSTAPEFGIDIGYQPYIPFGLGIEAAYSEPEQNVTGAKLQRTSVLAKATYNFGGDLILIRDSYLGFGVGAVFQDDETTLASAPIVGFDIPIRDRNDQASLSLGANAKYLTVEGDEPDALSVNGVVKYWY